MDVTIATLDSERWPEAAAMTARAFWTEEYMRILAEDALERYAIVHDLYLGMNVTAPTTTVLGAFAGDHVVGIACIEAPGSCFFCSIDPHAPEPEDHTGRVMRGVDLSIRELHAGLPEHANVGPVAVEPALQGLGIGGKLVAAAWQTGVDMGSATVVLDCDPRLLSFYMGCGFRPVGRVTDPWGFEIVGLRRDPVEDTA
jgi:GNAT superfamily N-acetyltransferase